MSYLGVDLANRLRNGPVLHRAHCTGQEGREGASQTDTRTDRHTRRKTNVSFLVSRKLRQTSKRKGLTQDTYVKQAVNYYDFDPEDNYVSASSEAGCWVFFVFSFVFCFNVFTTHDSYNRVYYTTNCG